jgi:flagellar protein FlaG
MKIREADVVVLPAASVQVEASALPAAGVAATPRAAPPVAEPARAELEQAVERANRQIASLSPALEFEIDPDTSAVVIRLVDRHSQSVLRQVPSPEMLAIAKALERMQSMLVRVRA